MRCDLTKLLAVHISTTRRWIRQGRLPAYRLGDTVVRVLYDDPMKLLTPSSSVERTECTRTIGRPAPVASRRRSSTTHKPRYAGMDARSIEGGFQQVGHSVGHGP